MKWICNCGLLVTGFWTCSRRENLRLSLPGRYAPQRDAIPRARTAFNREANYPFRIRRVCIDVNAINCGEKSLLALNLRSALEMLYEYVYVKKEEGVGMSQQPLFTAPQLCSNRIYFSRSSRR